MKKSRDVARDRIHPIENRPEGLEDATDDFGLNRRNQRDRQGESENPYPQWNSNKIRPVSHGSSYQVCAPDHLGHRLRLHLVVSVDDGLAISSNGL